MYHLSFIILC